MYCSEFSGPRQSLKNTGSKWTFYSQPQGRNAEAAWRRATWPAVKSFPEAIPLALRQLRRIEWNLIWKAAAVPLEAQRMSLRTEKELISLTLDTACSHWRAQPSLWTCIWESCSCCSCCSVSQSCPTLCDPVDCSTPGFPVLHHLPELAQTHIRWLGDAIQPSHPLSPPSPAFSLSQHQGLFQWVGSSHQVAKVLELQHQSFQWIFWIDFL